jgi:hypothetical protein
MRPDELLHFVELDEFGADWMELGLDVESDLWSLQMTIMSAPGNAPVISGTGGLRNCDSLRTAGRRAKVVASVCVTLTFHANG